MRSGVIAQKMGMTRLFTEAGNHVPVTVLRLAQCQVIAHRSKEKDGYVALQLGSGTRKVKNVSKAERGRFAVAKVEPKRTIAEFRVSEDAVIPVTVSIGVAALRGEIEDALEFVKKADTHLFSAKEGGRNRVVG